MCQGPTCFLTNNKIYRQLTFLSGSVFLMVYLTLQICKMKMFSVAHKTVFVVDHCPYMAESSRQQVECDVLTKSRAQGVIPLAPVSKSLWTCAVECSMEYCRILYDVYPKDKLVSVCFLLFVHLSDIIMRLDMLDVHLLMSSMPLIFSASSLFSRLITL